MGFFDDLPVPPPPEPPPEPAMFPWMGPPAGWVGGWVPWHPVVMRSDDVHAVVTAVYAFPSGVLFTLSIRVRPSALPGSGPFDPPLMMGMHAADGPLFGVGFADGRRTAFHQPPQPPGEDPGGPVLSMCGGSGGGGREQLDVWLWPLPPVGPLTLVTAWPALEVAETVTTVDAGELLSAADRAEALWPEEPERQGGYSRTIESRAVPPGTVPEPDD